MSDLDLEKIIRAVTIFYRTSPKHKLKIVKVTNYYQREDFLKGIDVCSS